MLAEQPVKSGLRSNGGLQFEKSQILLKTENARKHGHFRELDGK